MLLNGSESIVLSVTLLLVSSTLFITYTQKKNVLFGSSIHPSVKVNSILYFWSINWMKRCVLRSCGCWTIFFMIYLVKCLILIFKLHRSKKSIGHDAWFVIHLTNILLSAVITNTELKAKLRKIVYSIRKTSIFGAL